MSNIASYILSSYSFIDSNSHSQILNVGDLMKDGEPIPSFDEDLLIELCMETTKLLEMEHTVLELKGDFFIVGDIHGSLHDLLRIIKYIKENEAKVLFLGDYVDRGHFSLECITLLFAMKLLKPDEVFLIRGNHEFDSICSKYGFKDEIVSKENQIADKHKDIDKLHLLRLSQNHRYKYTENLYNAFIDAFSYLPIAALINKTTFCIHGGLCPRFHYIKNITFEIHRPIKSFDENELLKNIVWSDPSSDTVNMFHKNQRGCGYEFNLEAVHFFLERNELKRIVRGHQYVEKGYEKLFQNKCITVFSASSYDHDMSNNSGLLKLNENTDLLDFIMFPPIHRILKDDAFYNKVKVYNSESDQFHPKCYVFPPLNSLGSKCGINTNSTPKLIPNRSFIKTSYNIVHLCKYPIHKSHRKTNPLIKIHNSLLRIKPKSLLVDDQVKTDDADMKNRYPVTNLELIQE